MDDPFPHPLVILFDGDCQFCNAWVTFIIRHDPRGAFRFAPRTSDAARRLLILSGVAPDALDSIVLFVGTSLATRSDAILQIFARLGFPWRLVSCLVVIPRLLRDAGYALIARNRHRLRGRRDRCLTAGLENGDRFLR